MIYAVLGYGISGRSAEKLLKSKDVHNVDIFDDMIPAYPSVSLCNFEEYDKVVVSPGIDSDKINIPHSKITSEVEIAFENVSSDSKIIGVTGTNGKSTITYLTWQILKELGVNAVFCGNIGKTFSDVIFQDDYSVYVVELSSYQIDLLNNFRMDSFCICNVTPDHLERYKDMKRYISSKLSGLKFVDADKSYLLDTPAIKDFKIPNDVNFIDPEMKKFPVLNGSILDFGRFYADIDSFSLPGDHNVLNLTFALCMADEIAGLKGDLSHVVSKLKSLEHRCENFAEFEGVQYINDSKSTNPESTKTALKALYSNVTLLMGGRIKKADYSQISELINKKVKKLILFGEAAETLYDQFKDMTKVEIKVFKNLKEAAENAYSGAKAGDTIILSPGCSSFDGFKNFEERGKYFKEVINKKIKGYSLNV